MSEKTNTIEVDGMELIQKMVGLKSIPNLEKIIVVTPAERTEFDYPVDNNQRSECE